MACEAATFEGRVQLSPPTGIDGRCVSAFSQHTDVQTIPVTATLRMRLRECFLGARVLLAGNGALPGTVLCQGSCAPYPQLWTLDSGLHTVRGLWTFFFSSDLFLWPFEGIIPDRQGNLTGKR